MTKAEATELCKKKWGDKVRLEQKFWPLPSTGAVVTMCYCWLNGVIKSVGKDWASLVE